MKVIKSNNWRKFVVKHPSFSFLLLVFIFYFGIFLFLRNKLLFTPDFGESDAYHLNLSLKYFLAQNLKANRLPFWTDQLQGGYPLFSEGQIGALFLPNIVFLKFFSFADGYNLLLIFSLFCLTAGFYLLLKEFKINTLVALLTSLIFTFNGAISLRWVHLNLIQSFSLTPLLFWLAVRYLSTQKKRYLLLSSIVISQMIFAGHTQAVFISLLGLCLFYITLAFLKNDKWYKITTKLLILCFVIFSGFVLALPQILPTYLLTQYSSRSLFLDYNLATSFPLTFGHLISFLVPYPFGNPKFGTYPQFSNNWGIFWENTPYFGIVFFAIFTVIFLLASKKILRDKKIVYFLAFSGLFTLIALGRSSPLYFIFNFFPFNSFRTPSKYLLMSVFYLVLSASLAFDCFYQRVKNILIRVAFLILLMISVVQIIKFTFDYHLFLDRNPVLKNPQITDYLDNSLYISIGQPEKWNDIFLKKGWQDKDSENNYLFLKNFLYPNANLIYNKKIYNINTGTFKLKRPDYYYRLIASSFKLENDEITVSGDNLPNNLRILGIKNIITSLKIKDDSFRQVALIKEGDKEIYLYQISSLNESFFYIPGYIKKITYLEDFADLLANGKLSENDSVSEDLKMDNFVNNEKYQISEKQHGLYKSSIKGDFDKETAIVFRQNFFPEWSVYMDGKRANVFKVNLVHIGVFIPKGEHSIELKYENKYFKFAAVAALVYLALLFFFMRRVRMNAK